MLYPIDSHSHSGVTRPRARDCNSDTALLAVQYLLLTGSVYCDGTFRTGNFTGEGIKGLSAIAVKTHNIHPNFKGPDMKEGPPSFGSAILLVRNPKDALVADWHRRRNNRNTNDNVSNHVLSVGPEYFGEPTIMVSD